jgi:outer membrane protein TolC
MHRSTIFPLVGFSLSLLLGPNRADARESDDPALDALVAEALEKSPVLEAAEQSLERARSLPAQAGALPDLWVSLSYQNDGWAPSLGSENMTFLRFGFSQDLPYSGKRSLRVDLARRDFEIAEHRVSRARLDVVSSVKRGYYGVLEARGLLELLREEQEIWRQIEGVARARYGVGQGVQQDVIRVQVELTRIEQRRVELEADMAVSLASLNALLGRAPGELLSATGELALERIDSSLAEILEASRAKSPELLAARVAIDRARQSASLAEREKKPDFRLMGAYMNRGGLPAMWEAGVDVRLPLYGEKWDALVEEARASLRESELRLASLELVLRVRTEERYAQLRARERIVDLYENGIIPQDRLSVEAALASYRVGAVPFVTVLEALSRLYLDRATLLRTFSEHEKIRALLEAASLGEEREES